MNTLREFPKIASKAEWQSRTRQIREQILVSCGLWPMPDRTPLKAEIFGKIIRDGYSVEKVHLQPYPGFYLAGNLYRPVGRGDGPFPAILNPHGHWSNGRMADTAEGSIAARCISFARQGMIAFSYDMVGYNDTKQVGHNFANQPAHLLWNISLMGLQTWNSIRALDFLESLPDADKTRLGCTGESGGGTQTFMLGAIDGRLAVQAPIVMVSHSMQGGCLCENAPGLRVEYSNMELAAAPVPRPQILVAATGDWTKGTPTIEGPAIESVYRLFNAADKLRYVRFDFGHNYNRTSREAVYEWFGKWLLNHRDPASLIEAPYQKEPDQDLRVWPDGKLPEDALKEPDLIRSLISSSQSQLAALKPKDRRSVDQFKQTMRPAWIHTLQIELPEKGVLAEVGDTRKVSGYTLTKMFFGRSGRGDRLPGIMVAPSADSHRILVILVHPAGKAASLDTSGNPTGLAKKLLDRGHSVLLFDAFLTGEMASEEAQSARKPFANYFTTYNRTDLQERVQDLITLATFAQTYSKGRRVVLCGAGRAGLWALLAAPAADAVIAECDALDSASDEALLAPDLFVPGLRKMGSFEGAAALAIPHPLLVHNTGANFSTNWLRESYAAANAATSFQSVTSQVTEEAVVDWIQTLKLRSARNN